MGYEDLVDHDQLRHDPVLATLAGKLRARRKGSAPLAGKSTLNRLEHAPVGPSRDHKIGHDGAAIERLFVDLFLVAHQAPPRQIVLDLDATDDPLHGHQEGRFCHGYYDCHCYLPLYMSCGSQLLAAKLRRSNIDASAGAVEEIARIVAQIRAYWPRVEILLRADSGFAREALMSWCEAHRVDYVFGLARNERLVGAIAADLALAEAESLAQGGAARRFADFAWRTLDSWSRARRVVAKAEHLPKGSNPRWADLHTGEKDKEQPRYVDDASRRVRAGSAYETQFAAATCGTIRLKLLKIGAQVRLSVRRIKIAMASACPYQTEYHLAYLYLKRAAAF